MSTTVKNLLSVLNQLFPPDLASEWDSIGIIQGKKSQTISGILLCVDITTDTFLEAQRLGLDAIVSHHPLYLDDELPLQYKLNIMKESHERSIALLNVHTNADAMNPGVSDALAQLLGVKHLEVLEPLSDARYGIGRIGDVAEMSHADFVAHIQRSLPGSVVRSTRAMTESVKRVALCAGSGASLLPLVRVTDADVYITSDLKHHAVSEHLQEGGCSLIDIDHGVAESLFLEGLKASLEEILEVKVIVSELPFGNWVAQ
ncbi:MAG: Nif3-like dinuclear metal center hexameric protein [Candidatus Nanopelagicales bacterium]